MAEEKSTNVEIRFEVPGTPVPKMRMTRQDKWLAKNPRTPAQVARVKRLNRHWAWVNAVRLCFHSVNRGRHFFKKCEMCFKFYVAGDPPTDLDNYIKGVKDSLNGVAYPDDRVRHVRRYYGDPEVILVCESCDRRGTISKGKNAGELKPNCGAVTRCPFEKSVISIREIAP
jgi:Holliday junction resolvase RusA-like endonuclease